MYRHEVLSFFSCVSKKKYEELRFMLCWFSFLFWFSSDSFGFSLLFPCIWCQSFFPSLLLLLMLFPVFPCLVFFLSVLFSSWEGFLLRLFCLWSFLLLLPLNVMSKNHESQREAKMNPLESANFLFAYSAQNRWFLASSSLFFLLREDAPLLDLLGMNCVLFVSCILQLYLFCHPLYSLVFIALIISSGIRHFFFTVWLILEERLEAPSGPSSCMGFRGSSLFLCWSRGRKGCLG